MSQFGIDNCPTSTTNKPMADGSPEITQPSCSEWQLGLGCESRNFIGKLNWLFNKITACLFDLTSRVVALENKVVLVDLQFVGDSQIIEVYSDGSTEVNDVSAYSSDIDTDTRLTNPRISDPDNDGNPNITWDIVDASTNQIIGIETYEVPDRTGEPVDLCQVPIATEAELDAASNVSYLTCVDGQLRRAFGLAETCVAVNVQDNAATGTSYARADFNFTDDSPTQVSSSTSLSLVVDADNAGLSLLSLSANRFRIAVATSNQSGVITMTFGSVICDLVLDIFDVDDPVETVGGWSKAPDSIAPPYGDGVNTKVSFTNINSNVLTFNYASSAEATVIFIDSLTECAPCVAGQRCTDTNNNVTLKDLSGNTLINHSEC